MFYCDRCGDTDCCERCDLLNEPVLCDSCYDLMKLRYHAFIIFVIADLLILAILLRV